MSDPVIGERGADSATTVAEVRHRISEIGSNLRAAAADDYDGIESFGAAVVDALCWMEESPLDIVAQHDLIGTLRETVEAFASRWSAEWDHGGLARWPPERLPDQAPLFRALLRFAARHHGGGGVAGIPLARGPLPLVALGEASLLTGLIEANDLFGHPTMGRERDAVASARHRIDTRRREIGGSVREAGYFLAPEAGIGDRLRTVISVDCLRRFHENSAQRCEEDQ